MKSTAVRAARHLLGRLRRRFRTRVLRKRTAGGAFLPYMKSVTNDIVPAGIALGAGWHDLESEDSLYPWRWMSKTAQLSLPAEVNVSCLLLAYTGHPGISGSLRIEGGRGFVDFPLREGHQIVTLWRHQVADYTVQSISLALSEISLQAGDPRSLGIRVHEIATSGHFRSPSRKGGPQTDSIALCGKEDLDGFIGLSHHFASVSNAALMHLFDCFHYRFPSPPGDPFSEAYIAFWENQYKEVCNRSYDTAYEAHEFSEAFNEDVFPYCTRTPSVIGNQLIGMGSILRVLDGLAPNAAVLEMGTGWGNVALQLGLSGFRVTVLDIEKRFLNIVNQRFARQDLQVKTLHGDFFSIKDAGDSYSAIIFYECFHHCLRHADLLDVVLERLAPGGILVFAGETIVDDYPHAWGLNAQGQGIWSIRHHGWMELCFSTAYFRQLLDSRGLEIGFHECPQTPAGKVFTARRRTAQ
ncbi:hypothetical protein BH11PSE7_BH11PSE7_28800 [soil metagenome]